MQRHIEGQVEDKSKGSDKRVVDNLIGKMRGHVKGQVRQVGGFVDSMIEKVEGLAVCW